MKLTIRPAQCSDAVAVEELLRGVALPTEDLPADLAHFVVGYDQHQLAGIAGMEYYGPLGLLRSVAVSPVFRDRHLGRALVDAVLDSARQDGIREAYLITTTADAYFLRYGFTEVKRAEVPEAIRATSQFSALCPASAVIMKMSL